MVLTNAQRQARYRERLKAAASSGAEMSEALTELLARHRGTIEDLDQQIEMLEKGEIRFFWGSVDATGEAIARAKAQRSELQALVDKYDPQGTTTLPPVE